MRCERCKGTGREYCRRPDREFEIMVLACGDCAGSGQQYCCDGICEQPPLYVFGDGGAVYEIATDGSFKVVYDEADGEICQPEIDSDGRSDQKPNG